MTARDCVKGKIAVGRVSRRAGAKILALMSEHEARLGASDGAGADEAAREALTVARHDASRRQGMAAQAAITQADMLRVGQAYDGEVARLRAEGKAPFALRDPTKTTLGDAFSSLFTRDPNRIGGRWDNIDMLAQTIRGEAHAKLADMIMALRPKMLGLKREALKEVDVLKAMFGEASTPEGRAFAGRFGEASEDLRQQFNRAAGFEAVAANNNWKIGNPTFDAAKVAAVPQQEFVRRMTALIDRAKTLDWSTRKPLADDKLSALLGQMHEDASLGYADGAPSARYVGRGPLAASRSAQRVLTYKDAESWLTARREFGDGGGVFDTMMGHVRSMAHDIAVMRVLGPDPAAGMRFLKSAVDRDPATMFRAGEPDDAASQAATAMSNRGSEASREAAKKWLDAHYADVTGQAGAAVNPQFARVMANVRHWLMAAQLGSAILKAAPSDTALTLMTTRFNGLPVTGMAKALVKSFAEGGVEYRGIQAALVGDSLINSLREADRFVGETYASGLAQKMSTAVIRGSGHRWWTANMRDTFGLETMANLANRLEEGRAFGDLDPRFHDMLERYGVGAEDWAKLKDVKPWEPEPGATFLRPMDVREAGHDRLADSLMRMIRTEIHYTAIEGDAYTRVLQSTLSGGRPGTFAGELGRAFWQYKSWPMTILTTHLAQGFSRGWDGSRLSHLGATVVATTILGMVWAELQQVTLGRQPLNTDPTKPEGRQAWLKAMIGGGGLGLLSDVAFSDQHSSGASAALDFLGPTGGAVADAINYVRTNTGRMNRGEPTDWLGDAWWTGSRYVPGANFAPLRLLIQRELMDQGAKWADPRAPERFKRMEDWAKRDFHQDYWWKPGQTAPSAGVDLGKMWR